MCFWREIQDSYEFRKIKHHHHQQQQLQQQQQQQHQKQP